LPAEGGEIEAEQDAALLQPGPAGGKVFGEIPAHAGVLRSLPGEQKCGFMHHLVPLNHEPPAGGKRFLAGNTEIAAKENLPKPEMYNIMVPHENRHRQAVAARFWQRSQLG
jgi:hypothetical protein